MTHTTYCALFSCNKVAKKATTMLLTLWTSERKKSYFTAIKYILISLYHHLARYAWNLAD